MNIKPLFIAILFIGLFSSCDRPVSAGKAQSLGAYAVVDLAAGPDAKRYEVTFLDDLPADFGNLEYKTNKLVLRWIEPGTFEMGERSVAAPVRSVELTSGFYMAVCEVTQAQWSNVMGPTTFHYDENPDFPAESISWDDIRGADSDDGPEPTSFLGRLSAKAPGLRFDLPTEAQWEFTCRAATTTEWSFGDSIDDADDHICSDDNSAEGPQEAGTLQPNPWGLFDLHGNVAEWCRDRHGPYPRTAETDPTGPLVGWHRIWRGGSWDVTPYLAQSAVRSGGLPSGRYPHVGFRPISLPSK